MTWEWAPRVYGWALPGGGLLADGTPTHIGTRHVYNDQTRTETVTEAANVAATYQSPSLGPLNHDSPQTVIRYDALGRVDWVSDPLNPEDEVRA